MAFCTQCGSSAEGAFCIKCGAKIDAPGTPAAPPPPPPPPPAAAPAAAPIVIPAPPAPARKKGRFIFWALGGCLVLIGIVVVIFLVGGSYVLHRIGFDSGLMQNKPELAMAKMLVSANPDLEVLSVDEDSGSIKVRNKKTGEALTVDLKDAKNGKFVFLDEKNRKIEIQSQGEGENAALKIQSDEGSVQMGANASGRMPGWLPAYPGAAAAGGMAFSKEGGNSGSCTYRSNDSVESVIAYYEDALKNAGFEVQKSTTPVPGQGSVTILSASDDKSQRKASVTATQMQGSTTITLTFESQ
jgi:hypothetical protein